MARPDSQTADKIRRESKHWPNRVLARRYNVSLKTISLILNGRTHASAG